MADAQCLELGFWRFPGALILDLGALFSRMNPALAHRRQRVAAALPLDDALLVIGAGEPVPLPEGSDQTYPYRSHAEYYYLAGQDEGRLAWLSS